MIYGGAGCAGYIVGAKIALGLSRQGAASCTVTVATSAPLLIPGCYTCLGPKQYPPYALPAYPPEPGLNNKMKSRNIYNIDEKGFLLGVEVK